MSLEDEKIFIYNIPKINFSKVKEINDVHSDNG